MHKFSQPPYQKRKAESHNSTVMMDLDQEPIPLGQEAFPVFHRVSIMSYTIDVGIVIIIC